MRSPALLLLLLIGVCVGVEWIGTEWLRRTLTSPVTARDRSIYPLLILWKQHALLVVLLLFGLFMLRRSVQGGFASAFCVLPLRAHHLIVAILLPLGAIWAAREIWDWAQAIALARRLAGTGESLLWLVRRPGRITFLTDPGPPLPIVISHNIFTGAIALLGYVLFFLWWAWALVWLVARPRSAAGAVTGFLAVGGLCLIVGWGMQRFQDWLPLAHPMAVWMFPPAVATYAGWRMELLSPLHHLALYVSMHLAILIMELGFVELLKRAYETAEERLWMVITHSPRDVAGD